MMLVYYLKFHLAVSSSQQSYTLPDISAEPDTGRDPVNDLLSTPFSVRFESLLKRLSEHKRLFDIELRAGRHTALEDFISKVVQDLEEREKFMQESIVKRHLEDVKKTRDRKDSTLG